MPSIVTMSAPNEFKWVNSSKPRAKAIPPKVWEAHRAEIIDLYVRTSLENMMAVMRQRGFHAK